MPGAEATTEYNRGTNLTWVWFYSTAFSGNALTQYAVKDMKKS